MELVNESNAMRKGEDIDQTPQYFTGNTNLNEDLHGVVFTDNKTEWLNKAISIFKSDEFKANPLLTKVLAYTNKEVKELNAIIRTKLFGKDAPKYVVGDMLMAYQSWGFIPTSANTERGKGGCIKTFM